MIEIKSKANTPEVKIDKEKGKFCLTGRSYPEHPELFYNPIIEEVKTIGDRSKLEIEMTFDYLNTSSTKVILNFLNDLKELFENISVVWTNEEDDEDMLESGQFFADFSEIPFTFQEVDMV